MFKEKFVKINTHYIALNNIGGVMKYDDDTYQVFLKTSMQHGLTSFSNLKITLEQAEKLIDHLDVIELPPLKEEPTTTVEGKE